MVRPRCRYKIGFCPKYRHFLPEGVSCTQNCIKLREEEFEALRLKNIKGFDQTAAAEKMKISQSSFQRILSRAYKKVSEAIVYGKEIQIVKSIEDS